MWNIFSKDYLAHNFWEYLITCMVLSLYASRICSQAFSFSSAMDPHARIARRVYFVCLACSALVISTTFYLETRVSHVMFPAAVGYIFVAVGQAQPILGIVGAWRRGRSTLFLFWSISTVVVIVSFIFICVWLALYAEIRVIKYECKTGIANRTKEECDRVAKFNLDTQREGSFFLDYFSSFP